MSKVTLGFVCTGNTCRSPILEWWVKEALMKGNLSDQVSVWSAGLNATNTGRIAPGAVRSLDNSGPYFQSVDTIRGRPTRVLSEESTKTDFLFWITDSKSMQEGMKGEPPRIPRILAICEKLSAELIIIPEPDMAIIIMEKYKGDDEKSKEAYDRQSARLSKYVEAVLEFIKEPTLGNHRPMNSQSRNGRILLIP